MSVASRFSRLSLRARCGVLIAVTVAVAVVAMAAASWLVTRGKLYQQFDDQLHSYAQLSARTGSAAEAIATLRSGEGNGPDDVSRRPRGLVVQFVSGRPAHAVGTAGGAGLPITTRARQVAEAGAQDDVETVVVRHDRYRMWTVRRAGGAVQVAQDAEGVEDTLTELALLHTVLCVCGVVAAAVCGGWVARAALRPMDSLTAGAERVASTKDLTQRIEVSGRGEIARLADAFNSMLSALGTSRTAQRQLVEDAGHELRTPLTSLRNNVELLVHADAQQHSGKVLGATDRARLLADLTRQSEELGALIGELVDLAKQEASPEPRTRVQLAEPVTAALDRVRSRAHGVRFDVAMSGLTVLGQPAALERLAMNLLDNAAKWSPSNGMVRVRIGEVPGGQVQLTVADEGPGIAVADRARVFERFYRAARARALPGSGLGLAIVAQIVAAHEGTVTVATADGGGALLTVTLPVAADSQPTPWLAS